MRKLGRLIPRNLATRKARSLLTTLGIALGVAAILANNIVRESATQSVSEIFDHAAGRADLAVTNAVMDVLSSEGFDAATQQQVAATPGVATAAPLLQIASLPATELDDWEYSVIFGNFNGAVVYGIDPEASRSLEHYRLAAGDDLAPGDENALLLSKRYAEELGVGLGDALEMVAPSGQVRFTVTGLLAADGLARVNHGQVGVTTLATAQRVFERPETLDQIDVVAAPNVDIEELRERLQATLGKGFRVLRPGNKGAIVEQTMGTLTVGIGFIGTLALVVGAFLIYNTFAMTVVERTRELGLLRALGMGRTQTAGLVLVEAAVLGAAGAVLGIFLGLMISSGMLKIAEIAMNSELTTLVIRPGDVALALGVGVVVALLASLAPAVRAGRLPVVQVIQRRRPDDGQVSKRQLMLGLILAIPSFAVTIGYAIYPVKVPIEFASTVVIALLVGVGLLIPATIPPLERMAGRLLGLLGVEGQLGGRNLARSPGRAALTAAALMFGLASVIIIGGVFNSAKETATDYIDRTLAADLWVSSPQRVHKSLADALETMGEVRLARPAVSLATRLVPPDGSESEIPVVYTAIDPERSRELDFYMVADGGDQKEALDRLAQGGAVLIASALKEWYDLDLGDSIRVQTLEGPVDFFVAGITYNTVANGYALTGVYRDAERYFGTDEADLFAINLTPGVDAERAGQRIVEKWGETYGLRFETNDGFRARMRQLSDTFSALSNIGVLVGVAVAALSVINTLLMNVFERQREIGALRALGMTDSQVLRLILSESMAMGIMGGALGLGLGIWLAQFIVASSASVSGYQFPFAFPVRSAAASVFIALFVPVLAGIWPAWRAARTNIVEAVRGE